MAKEKYFDRQRLKTAVQGAVVSQITKASPAERAGLKRFDIITRFSGKPIRSVDDFSNVLASCRNNKSVALSFVRYEREWSNNKGIQRRRDQRVRIIPEPRHVVYPFKFQTGGFRGIPWGANAEFVKEAIKDVSLSNDTKNMLTFLGTAGTFKAEIRVHFIDGQMVSGTYILIDDRFLPQDVENYAVVSVILESEYGEPIVQDKRWRDKRWRNDEPFALRSGDLVLTDEWDLQDTSITLQVDASNRYPISITYYSKKHAVKLSREQRETLQKIGRDF